ncbi:MAG: VWA domain-containing protein [Terriglobales bacterium]
MRTLALLALIFTAFALRAFPQEAQPPSPLGPPRSQETDVDKSPTIKVDVKLVNVFVTVTDEQGAPVGGLKKEDFEVFEDEQPQSIAVFDRESELPLSIVLSIDTSLSTRKDLKLELESARRFVHSTVRKKDAITLYQFSEVVSELVPFTSDLKRIDQGIARARVGAATALYDAIYLGGLALYDRQGRKVMVVITDGADTYSSVKYADAVRAAQMAEALVYSIIIVPITSSAGRNTGGEQALIHLAKETGGKYFYAVTPTELDEAFRQVSDELRTQYLLAYYPRQRLAKSDFRSISVLVKGAGMQAETTPGEGTPAQGSDGAGEAPKARFQVRHRAGYYTSKLK